MLSDYLPTILLYTFFALCGYTVFTFISSFADMVINYQSVVHSASIK